MNTLHRKLEDLHNELAHLRLFGYGLTYTQRLQRRVEVTIAIYRIRREM
jgi:hypothetical protein